MTFAICLMAVGITWALFELAGLIRLGRRTRSDAPKPGARLDELGRLNNDLLK